MRALELDVLRAEAERLVDDEIGDERADPGDGDHGIEAERLFQRAIDAELHQEERDRDVEDQPDDAARMAVRQPREEVRPGDRARIGVRHVDLELGQNDEHAHQSRAPLRARTSHSRRRRDTSPSAAPLPRTPCRATRRAPRGRSRAASSRRPGSSIRRRRRGAPSTIAAGFPCARAAGSAARRPVRRSGRRARTRRPRPRRTGGC